MLSAEEDPKKDRLLLFSKVTQMGAVSCVQSMTLNVTGSGISFCEVTIKSNSGIVSHQRFTYERDKMLSIQSHIIMLSGDDQFWSVAQETILDSA